MSTLFIRDPIQRHDTPRAKQHGETTTVQNFRWENCNLKSFLFLFLGTLFFPVPKKILNFNFAAISDSFPLKLWNEMKLR